MRRVSGRDEPLAAPSPRDTQRLRLLAWQQQRRQISSGGSSGGVDDDRRRVLLQRRRENMAQPSLKRLEERRKELGEGNGEPQDAGEMENQASPSRSSSSMEGGEEEGDNQRESSDEDERFEEAHAAERSGLGGSYFHLDGAETFENPFAFEPQDSDVEAVETTADPGVMRRTIEKIHVDVHVRHSVETLVERDDEDESPRLESHESSEDEASVSITQERLTPVLRSHSATATSEREADVTPAMNVKQRGWFMTTAWVAVLVALAASAVMAYLDPSSPWIKVLKKAGEVAVVYLSSYAVESGLAIKRSILRSSLAPVLSRVAVSTKSLGGDLVRLSKQLSQDAKSICSRTSSTINAQVRASASDIAASYQVLESKVLHWSASAKTFVNERVAAYVDRGAHLTDDVRSRLLEPLEAEKSRMDAIKQKLNDQEERLLKGLEKMKENRVAYTNAADDILSEGATMISDSIKEVKDSAKRHINSFTEKISLALKNFDSGNGEYEADDVAGIHNPFETEEPIPSEVDQTANVANTAGGDDSPVQDIDSILDDNVELATVAEIIEEIVDTADIAAAIDELSLLSEGNHAGDSDKLQATAGNAMTSEQVLAEIKEQHTFTERDVGSIAALEGGLEAQVTTEKLNGEDVQISAELHQMDIAEASDYFERGQDESVIRSEESIGEELRRIADEEKLELEIASATAKVAAELLKISIETIDGARTLEEKLQSARAAVESETMAHICKDAECAAKSVHDVVSNIAESAESILAPTEHISGSVKDSVIPAAKNIAPVVSPRSPVGASKTSREQLLPFATISAAFLLMAVPIAYFLMRSWKRWQMKQARQLRWRRRTELKQRLWETEDDDAEEVVLLSGPTMENGPAESDCDDNDLASHSPSTPTSDTSLDKDPLDRLDNTDDLPVATEHDSSDARKSVVTASQFDQLDTTSASSAPTMRVTRHTTHTQRALSFSPQSSRSRELPSEQK